MILTKQTEPRKSPGAADRRKEAVLADASSGGQIEANEA
jgi:hypothetical protein